MPRLQHNGRSWTVVIPEYIVKKYHWNKHDELVWQFTDEHNKLILRCVKQLR